MNNELSEALKKAKIAVCSAQQAVTHSASTYAKLDEIIYTILEMIDELAEQPQPTTGD